MGFPRQEYGMGGHFLLQGIFPTQGLNLSLLHRQVDSLPWSHLGDPLGHQRSCQSPFLKYRDLVLVRSKQNCDMCWWAGTHFRAGLTSLDERENPLSCSAPHIQQLVFLYIHGWPSDSVKGRESTLCMVKNLHITQLAVAIHRFNWPQIVWIGSIYHWKISACKWTLAIQTPIVQGSALEKMQVLVAQSRPTLFNPMDIAGQTSLFMEFARQEYCSGFLFSSLGDLPNPKDWTWVSCSL